MKEEMNVLITGATGLLGKSLIETDELSRTIIGIYFGKYQMKDAGNVKYILQDIQDKEGLGKIFRKSHADIVIHTAGIADVDFCHRHYDAAFKSNVVGTENIAELCREHGARLVYISTNAVFNGEKPPYKEDDRPDPVNEYGTLKLECERIVKSALDRYLIIRPILMYGWNDPRERSNLATFLLEKLSRAESVNMVTDIYDNPLLSYQCAESIWALAEKDKHGVYHVAGRDIVNRYDYARAIADVFGLDDTMIRPVENSFFKEIAPRPKNTSYDTSKLTRETGFDPLGIREGLSIMKRMRKGYNGRNTGNKRCGRSV